MNTLRLKLTWPDGAEVTAEITAETANDRAPVIYSGARERLVASLDECAASTLEEIFRQTALEKRATLSVERSTEWADENNLT